ncbi:GGDEF domain-containing protein [Massilia sp. W12]|uniref:GGDEF domain-containing protein n=1 Tax=Massilia sp. W12 TaxID=3126507 RepID=UPI0030CC0509
MRSTGHPRWQGVSAMLLWLLHLFHPNQPERQQDDSRQLQRIRRFGRASWILVAWLCGLLGLFSAGQLPILLWIEVAALGLTGFLLFAFLLFSGLNQRAQDKTLTAPMAGCMLALMSWALYTTPATQILFSPFALLITMSCAFRLREKTLLLVALGALFSNLAAQFLHYLVWHDRATLIQGLMHCGALGITLPGFVMLATRVRRLYRSLYMVSVKMESIEEHARRDELTGSFNRRYMMAALQQQKHLADATDQSLCLAVIDLDHFKRINDEIGHLAGDEVLRTFARLAQQSVRREDVFGRYGGEEFLLLLPGIELQAAFSTVERIRAMTETRLGIIAKVERKVTVSIGLTQYIPGESVLDLFARADTAMYLAKTGGRNQVVMQEAVEERD